MAAAETLRPVVLCILDGWGEGPDYEGNAITRADTPNWDRFRSEGLLTTVETSGPAVGLPEGQMGNSEVGHINMGAGRIIYQDIVRIDRDIREGRFRENEVLRGVMERTQAAGRTLHLAGLVGPGGVHSHERHMGALLEMAASAGLDRDQVQVHAVLDGRDTPPRSANGFLKTLAAQLDSSGVGVVATVSGRYYSMDRDQRWERIELGYRAMVDRQGRQAGSMQEALDAAYAAGENDEFVTPTVIDGGRPVAEGDGFVFVNFRPDRARQMTRALAEPGFDAFAREDRGLDYVCMTQYDDSFPRFAQIAYPPERPTGTIGEVLADQDLTQLRIAETEKYAHVTYFFSGGREEPFPGEERILVPSPKVATYDQQPEMNAPEVTERLITRLQETPVPDLIVLNFANPDMVGHTGVMSAAISAVETIDTCLGTIWERVKGLGGAMIVTGDHGNVEEMIDDAGEPVTKHSVLPVPFLLLVPDGAFPAGASLRGGGILADVAPTLLDLLGVDAPDAWDRRSLLARGA